ncbi:MAG: hypothetical protein EOO27_26905 [Comamonadaceae bacterium]|nr:MAG: hypothetical protein EOO27_26905 [Comamonadaceae bacterium]
MRQISGGGPGDLRNCRPALLRCEHHDTSERRTMGYEAIYDGIRRLAPTVPLRRSSSRVDQLPQTHLPPGALRHESRSSSRRGCRSSLSQALCLANFVRSTP